jgi:hypothetical protein
MSSEEKLKSIAQQIQAEKKLFLARGNIYPHLVKLQDSVLEIKGVTMAAAAEHDCDFDLLWQWVMDQAGK